MRVALTGASGFVGRHVLAKLLEAGHDVRALYRMPPKAGVTGVAIVQGDLASLDALSALVKNVEVVLHVAGAVSAPRSDDFHRINVEGTRTVVQAARTAGVRRFIHVSSLAARKPELSPYAASKRAGEDVVFAAAPVMSTCVLRPSAVYGPGDTATLPLLKILMSQVGVVPGRRDQRFSLVHVDDLAAVCADAVSSTAEGVREIDDLSGGHSWGEMIGLTRAVFGRPSIAGFLPYVAAYGLGMMSSAFASLTGASPMLTTGKVREMYEANWVVEGVNWPRRSHVSLDVGLPQTIRWHQARGDLPRVSAPPRSAHKG
jgi:nucleoside-diphosphate-sugar epimerase